MTKEEVLKAVGYTIYDSIFVSLMAHFDCADKESKRFLAECIFRYLSDKRITMDGWYYHQTLGNIMCTEYIIVRCGEEYDLHLRDEYEETDGWEEYFPDDDDYNVIIEEMSKNIIIFL